MLLLRRVKASKHIKENGDEAKGEPEPEQSLEGVARAKNGEKLQQQVQASMTELGAKGNITDDQER